jgi:hypothetical protein
MLLNIIHRINLGIGALDDNHSIRILCCSGLDDSHATPVQQNSQQTPVRRRVIALLQVPNYFPWDLHDNN